MKIMMKLRTHLNHLNYLKMKTDYNSLLEPCLFEPCLFETSFFEWFIS